MNSPVFWGQVKRISIFEELLLCSSDKNIDRFIIDFYITFLSNEKIYIRRAPIWFVVYLISNRAQIDTSFLQYYSREELLTIISSSWNKNIDATNEFLKNAQSILDIEVFSSWLLLNSPEKDFEDIISSFNISLEKIPDYDLKKVILNFPVKVLNAIDLTRINEVSSVELFKRAVELNQVDLFFEKIISVRLEHLRWSNQFWFEIISTSADHSSVLSNKLFIKLYPLVLDFLKNEFIFDKQFRIDMIFPFGRFGRYNSLENLRFSLLKLFNANRLTIPELLICLNSKNEMLGFIEIVRDLSKHDRAKFISVLNSYSGTRDEADKIYFMLSKLK